MKKIKQILSVKKNQLILLILITILTYINILPNGFAWDDKDFLVNWPTIKSTEDLPAVLRISDLLQGDLPTEHRGIYRPIRSIHYLVAYGLWGENPVGYHIQAIIFHTLIVVLIYLITEKITKKSVLSFVVAILFAVHPIHTEAVTYITASFDTLGILFFFLAFYLYLKSQENKQKRKIYLLGSVIYGFFAAFIYEVTLVLPICLLLYEFSFKNYSLKKIPHILNKIRYFFLIPTTYVFIRFFIFGIGDRASFLGSAWQIAANQARVGLPEIFYTYIWWLIWPLHLNISHSTETNFLDLLLKLFSYIDSSGRLLDLVAQISFIFPFFYITMALLVIYTCFKKNALLFFSLSWFIVTLIPVSSIIPQGSTIAERFLYIPSFGFIFFLSTVFYLVYSTLAKSKSTSKYLTLVLVFLFVSITGFYGYLTIRRNMDWKNLETLWLSSIREDPSSYRPYAALANSFLRDGQMDKSIEFFRKSLELSPSNPKLISDLGLAYEKKGDIDNAIAHQYKAIEVQPQYFMAYIFLGNIYNKEKEYDLAEQAYKKAIDLRPQEPVFIKYLGDVYYNQNLFDKALEAYLKASKLDPNSHQLFYNVGLTYLKQGKYDLAINSLNKSLDLFPRDPLVYLALSKSYEEKGEFKKALIVLKEGQSLFSDSIFTKEIERINKNY